MNTHPNQFDDVQTPLGDILKVILLGILFYLVF